MEEMISVIINTTIFLFNGIAASVRVNESSHFTASIRYFFTNSPTVNGFECFAMRCKMVYAVIAFLENVGVQEIGDVTSLLISKMISKISTFFLY